MYSCRSVEPGGFLVLGVLGGLGVFVSQTMETFYDSRDTEEISMLFCS